MVIPVPQCWLLNLSTEVTQNLAQLVQFDKGTFSKWHCSWIPTNTVYARSDAAATTYFMRELCAATVWERRLVESSVYSLQPRRPLPRFNFCRKHVRLCYILHTGAAGTREGDFIFQQCWWWGDNSMAASNWERRLIEQIRYTCTVCRCIETMEILRAVLKLLYLFTNNTTLFMHSVAKCT